MRQIYIACALFASMLSLGARADEQTIPLDMNASAIADIISYAKSHEGHFDAGKISARLTPGNEQTITLAADLNFQSQETQEVFVCGTVYTFDMTVRTVHATIACPEGEEKKYSLQGAALEYLPTFILEIDVWIRTRIPSTSI